jgi:hypothetical protein
MKQIVFGLALRALFGGNARNFSQGMSQDAKEFGKTLQ